MTEKHPIEEAVENIQKLTEALDNMKNAIQHSEKGFKVITELNRHR